MWVMVTVNDMQCSLPLVIGEGDSLRGHFEVDHGRHGWRVGTQSHGGGLLHRLDACQGLHFHRAQVPNITGCRHMQKIPQKQSAHWCLSHLANTCIMMAEMERQTDLRCCFKRTKWLPAPCLSNSAAELVTDCEVVSTTSSRGSLSGKQRNQINTMAIWQLRSHSHKPSITCIVKWSLLLGVGCLPLSGKMSLQGRAKGVIECWQTSAVKLPEKQCNEFSISISGRYCHLIQQQYRVLNI